MSLSAVELSDVTLPGGPTACVDRTRYQSVEAGVEGDQVEGAGAVLTTAAAGADLAGVNKLAAASAVETDSAGTHMTQALGGASAAVTAMADAAPPGASEDAPAVPDVDMGEAAARHRNDASRLAGAKRSARSRTDATAEAGDQAAPSADASGTGLGDHADMQRMRLVVEQAMFVLTEREATRAAGKAEAAASADAWSGSPVGDPDGTAVKRGKKSSNSFAPLEDMEEDDLQVSEGEAKAVVAAAAPAGAGASPEVKAAARRSSGLAVFMKAAEQPANFPVFARILSLMGTVQEDLPASLLHAGGGMVRCLEDQLALARAPERSATGTGVPKVAAAGMASATATATATAATPAAGAVPNPKAPAPTATAGKAAKTPRGAAASAAAAATTAPAVATSAPPAAAAAAAAMAVNASKAAATATTATKAPTAATPVTKGPKAAASGAAAAAGSAPTRRHLPAPRRLPACPPPTSYVKVVNPLHARDPKAPKTLMRWVLPDGAVLAPDRSGHQLPPPEDWGPWHVRKDAWKGIPRPRSSSPPSGPSSAPSRSSGSGGVGGNRGGGGSSGSSGSSGGHSGASGTAHTQPAVGSRSYAAAVAAGAQARAVEGGDGRTIALQRRLEGLEEKTSQQAVSLAAQLSELHESLRLQQEVMRQQQETLALSLSALQQGQVQLEGALSARLASGPPHAGSPSA